MNDYRRVLVLLVAITGSAALLEGQGRAPDWPQWRGPTRDAVVSAFAEPKAWPDSLTKKWSVDVGLGYSTPILVGDRVYMFSRRDDKEVLAALDAATGKQMWESSYPAPFKMNPVAARHGTGPKSTPTFANGRLFTLGMGGIVTANDANTGKQLWQKPGSVPGPLYATGMSPLVDGENVIVHVGSHNQGALTAFNAATGAVKWSWTGDGPSYGSPIALDVDSTRQIVTLTQENLVGVSATSGELLWKRPFSTNYTQNAITPLVYRQIVIISGLDKPTTAFRIVKRDGQWTTENAWESPSTPLYMANALIVGDVLFGMTHRNSGQFFVLDAATGKTLWTGPPRQGTNAELVRAGNVVFVLKDDAELLVGRVGPNGFERLHGYAAAESSTWAPPVVSGSRIFVKDESKLTLWTIGG